ncbi:chloramphenicol phosphotransferase CPT family protein [Streptomyces sp. NPDC060194]|uniref:chloramphenicol phosphotransferase CPT family protein n=1 Tax=Streptomyces sp. NPDC060194 TaxID=3347069 RepID=UPI00365617CA
MTLVLLNGTSSSGKSSIAAELAGHLPAPVFRLAVDDFLRMARWPDDATLDELAAPLRRMRAGFHRAVAGMAAAGNAVVVDHVLSEPWRLSDCLDVLPAADVFFVGVRCSLDEVVRREAARGDRESGIAAAQFPVVHAHGLYDLTVDTTATSPAACARRIADGLSRRPRPTAFERLRAQRA